MKRKQTKRQIQLGFEILESGGLKFFGGSHLKNSHAKTKRPIATKRALHLVLRSALAKGKLSFLRREGRIYKVIYNIAKKTGVKVYRIANGGNHLHLIVLPSSRKAFQDFIRGATGVIAREVLARQRGRADSPGGDAASTEKSAKKPKIEKKLRFWDQRPFTRILEWGRDYKTVYNYMDQNSLEAWGFIPYTPRSEGPSLYTRKFSNPGFASTA